MKDLLLISQSASKYGGTEYDFLKLFNFLKEKYIVSVICPEGERFNYFKENSKSIFKTKFNVFPLFQFKIKSFFRYVAIYLYERRELKAFLKENRFEVAIINSTVCFLYLRLLKKYNIKTIIFLRENIRNVLLKKIIYKFIEKYADQVIAGSKFIYNGYEFLEGNKKLSIIYTTTDINEIQFEHKNEKWEAKKSHYTLLNIGGICENKNQELLVKACKLLNKNQTFKIVFIGNIIEKKYGLKLNDLMSEVQNKNVAFEIKNFMEKEFIKDYYLKSDFVIITSKSEGMPIVLLEALYFGKIIVSPPIGLVPELIKDNFNGFIYALDDYENLGQTINKAMEFNDLNSIRQHAFETFQNYPTLDENLKQTDLLIRKLING